MGTFKTRLALFLVWLVSGAGTLLGIKFNSVAVVVAFAVLFFGLGMGTGIILFGDPLPPGEGQKCKSCRTRQATTREHYWTTSYTIPAGSVALCDECAKGYDHNRDWSKA